MNHRLSCLLCLLLPCPALYADTTGSGPIVVAHRGFSWIAPENTLTAYRKAIEVGAEMAECDVYLTRDGVPVCIHDEELERTTNGTGKVGDKTLRQLRELDAGQWKDAEYHGERIPTLVELLQLVKGKLRLVIEIKQENIEQQIVDALREAKVEPESVMIFSFHYDAVRTIAKLEPLLPTTWLIDELPEAEKSRGDVLRRALRARVCAVGLSKKHVDRTFVRCAQQCGLPVFVWTVNEPDEIRQVVAAGVDAVITDRPDLAQEVLVDLRAAAGGP